MLCRGRIVQGDVTGETESDLAERVVHLEHFCAVDAQRVLIRRERALRYISCRKIIRFLTGVDLILQSDLNRITGECDRADGSDLGINASDAGDEEVCFGEVEEGRVGKRGDGGSCVDFCFAGDELTD